MPGAGGGGGYLPVNDRVMATALFVVLKDGVGDRATALAYLRPELRGTFKKALRQLGRFKGEIARLRRLDRDCAEAYENRERAGEAAMPAPAPAPIAPLSVGTAISIQMPPAPPRVRLEIGMARPVLSLSAVTTIPAGREASDAP